jgi:hypothetical protein
VPADLADILSKPKKEDEHETSELSPETVAAPKESDMEVKESETLPPVAADEGGKSGSKFKFNLMAQEFTPGSPTSSEGPSVSQFLLFISILLCDFTFFIMNSSLERDLISRMGIAPINQSITTDEEGNITIKADQVTNFKRISKKCVTQ